MERLVSGVFRVRPKQSERVNDDNHRDRGGQNGADQSRKTDDRRCDLISDPDHRVPQKRCGNSLQHTSDIDAGSRPRTIPRKSQTYRTRPLLSKW
jgi:hypothetical protein